MKAKPVEVNNVSITYITGDFRNIGFKEYVVRKITGNYEVQKFWADKNITFDLEKGDMLGIIGTNGAGKSTLLKAITGIMVPTEGTVKTRGKVAALLELASGFDGDLTVKENTYLRGALLGYTRQFIDEKYNEIIEFAELEEFEDRMFKQLSSGMKSRLGFSIACLVNPDIIILDEVLSVGDGSFRKKSRDRMKEILDRGVTGILVSHSVSQVREMCNKVLWLDHGNQIAFGDTKAICDAYEVFLSIPKKKRVVPSGMEEIIESSRRYNLFIKMSERERVENHNDEMIMNEALMDRQKRWLKKIDKMKDEERKALYQEFNIK
ncbi:ABC-2 type transport system ATP-binding protein [Lachnospiraceae bacterium]|nr:ABC-2 type transport system ATP-binding protein [Lachnospiraceae bacterium]